MKIVILDGHALNPGDLSWDFLNQFGSVTVYERTPDELIVPRIGDADIILLNKCPITAATLDACPSIKLICVLATGYNVVDTAAAKAKSMGMLCLKSFAEPMEGLQMLLLDSPVGFGVNELFCVAHSLQQNAPGILPHFLPACFQCAAVWGTGVVFAVCPAFVSGAHIPHIPARG